MKLTPSIGTTYITKREPYQKDARFCDCYACGTEIHYPAYRVTSRENGTVFYHGKCFEEKEKKRRDQLARGPKAL